MDSIARHVARAALPAGAYRNLRRIGRGTRHVLRRCSSIHVMPYTPAGDRYYHAYKFRQWYDRKPSPTAMLMGDYFYRMKTGPEISELLRVRVTDKAIAKDFIRERLGDRHLIPTIAVLENRKDALRFAYPDRCIVKPTHASGQVVIRKEGEPLDFDKIDFCFDWNYYFVHREANYRPLQPKMIVEPLIFDRHDPDDYKFFCWNGQPKFVQVDVDRFDGHARAFYDMDWRRLPFGMRYPDARREVPRPEALELMHDIARQLSAPFSFIRVDLYAQGSQVYVGELTNCPEAGSFFFNPRNAERYASDLLFS